MFFLGSNDLKVFTLLFLGGTLFFSLGATELECRITQEAADRYMLTFSFTLKKGISIDYDNIIIDTNSPHIILTTWQASQEPILFYDANEQVSKKIFNQSFELVIHATLEQLPASSTPIYLYITYYEYPKKKIRYKLVPLHFKQLATSFSPTINSTPPAVSQIFPTQTVSILAHIEHQLFIYFDRCNRLFFSCFFIFLLGIMLALLALYIRIFWATYSIPAYFLTSSSLIFSMFLAGYSLPLLSIGLYHEILKSEKRWQPYGYYCIQVMMYALILFLSTCYLPSHIVSSLMSLALLSCGIWYLYHAQYESVPILHRLKNSIGMMAIIGAMMMSAHSVKQWYEYMQAEETHKDAHR
jgi:hypothetical protein